ncbi:hypothetical protein F4782DRAFT_497312 [Xylaria castorea]|nr:hypothetical protein F4782DRAFT_497312 [Xylaria castorea]
MLFFNPKMLFSVRPIHLASIMLVPSCLCLNQIGTHDQIVVGEVMRSHTPHISRRLLSWIPTHRRWAVVAGFPRRRSAGKDSSSAPRLQPAQSKMARSAVLGFCRGA